MTFQTFRSKINRRQILILFIASWFLLHSFQILVYLTDATLLKMLEADPLTHASIQKLMGRMSGQAIAYYAMLPYIAGFVGIVVAFLISLFISIKKRWFWFNSFIVLIMINLFGYIDSFVWHILSYVFLAPGSLFGNRIVEFIINGGYLFVIGILLFFSKKTNLFISNNFQSTLQKDILLAAKQSGKFLLRINWRQVLIHFMAAWFLIYAFQVFSVLHDPFILNMMQHKSHDEILQSAINNKSLGAEFINFTYISDMSRFFAVLIAFIISLIISIKKHWFWFNSFIVLIVTYFLDCFNLLAWSFYRKAILIFGYVFKNIIANYFISGSIFLLISVLLFSLNHINKFIKNGNGIDLAANSHQEQEDSIPK